MVLCNTLTSKDTGNRRMSLYMLHLIALRDTDLYLCPPTWMNITQWVKITLQWILRALCKPVKPVPWTAVKLIFEFETWGCDDGRIDGCPRRQGAQTDQQTADKMFVAVAFLKKWENFVHIVWIWENVCIFAQKTYAAFHMSTLMSAGFGRFISLFYFRVIASCKR